MRPVDPYRANHLDILGIYMKSKKRKELIPILVNQVLRRLISLR